jgi:hypothetical protein
MMQNWPSQPVLMPIINTQVQFGTPYTVHSLTMVGEPLRLC